MHDLGAQSIRSERESTPKLANWRAPASSMDGVPSPSSCDSSRATRKRASGFTGQPLKMSLTTCAKLLAKPRTRLLELKFSLSFGHRDYCTALCTPGAPHEDAQDENC
jgi:hypothetical protein